MNIGNMRIVTLALGVLLLVQFNPYNPYQQQQQMQQQQLDDIQRRQKQIQRDMQEQQDNARMNCLMNMHPGQICF